MPRTKPTLEPIVQLPDHIKLTERELSLVARLIRVTRNEYCYLGLFIEYLLFNDADSPGEVTVEIMEKILNDVKNLRNWSNFLNGLNGRRPILANYSGLTSPDDPPQSVCREEDDQFYELVTMWRKEHPEPEKPRQLAPSGHLGQDEPGD